MFMDHLHLLDVYCIGSTYTVWLFREYTRSDFAREQFSGLIALRGVEVYPEGGYHAAKLRAGKIGTGILPLWTETNFQNKWNLSLRTPQSDSAQTADILAVSRTPSHPRFEHIKIYDSLG